MLLRIYRLLSDEMQDKFEMEIVDGLSTLSIANALIMVIVLGVDSLEEKFCRYIILKFEETRVFTNKAIVPCSVESIFNFY